jgi:signal transduction histidine kinase
LLAATLAGLAVALVLAGLALSHLFQEHVYKQFEITLTQQLDQLTARLDFDAAGQPQLDPKTLTDPRWQRPYSGLYWQIDGVEVGAALRLGVLRSRSLWDTSLPLAMTPMADGTVHVHRMSGPQGSQLLVVERTVQAPVEASASVVARWRLVVAADTQDLGHAVDRFTGVLALSLGVLFVLLALVAWAQVAVGLRPLRSLQRSLQAVQQGQTRKLEGEFPAEVLPLVNDFNRVLDHNAEVVARARTQAGNLAHALKTPLSVLDQATQGGAGADGELSRLVQEQLGAARRHIDWHLARARVAATQRLPGQRTEIGATVAGLIRVMARVHAERGLTLWADPALSAPPLYFAGEEQDLQEVLGNVLDNACKWARSRVQVRAHLLTGVGPAQLQIDIEDDGPGIADAMRASVLARGVRLDESVPGTGLGLAIVHDLVELYGGELALQPTEAGGLRVSLRLPAAVA